MNGVSGLAAVIAGGVALVSYLVSLLLPSTNSCAAFVKTQRFSWSFDGVMIPQRWRSNLNGTHELRFSDAYWLRYPVSALASNVFDEDV